MDRGGGPADIPGTLYIHVRMVQWYRVHLRRTRNSTADDWDRALPDFPVVRGTQQGLSKT